MDYNQTLNLPVTDFPMRAGLPKREPEMLEKWEKEKLYNRLMDKNKDKPNFILHDGPPFSNNDIHTGTALNKILKDFIVRYKNMTGFRAPYVPGWDNHGMPIESAIIKKNKLDRTKMTIPEFRNACQEFAQFYVDRHTEQFMRLGVIGQWDKPYLTMDKSFEAEEIKVFGKMAEKGYIYKGLKPVYWCAHDVTALAEAEIEYADDQCESIYVRFKVCEHGGKLCEYGDEIYFVIWTTTTWTLPGNVAISVHPDFEYALCKVGNAVYVIADTLKEKVAQQASWENMQVIGKIKGRELELIKTSHPFLDRESLVIIGDHVTAETGTGCVHTAPGHGADDYFVCQKYKQLPILVPVDDKGHMTAEAGEFEGLYYAKANVQIFEKLKELGALVASERINHPYPHCWRCKEPILFRATEQWFASVDAIKDIACAQVDNIKWLPEWGMDRMTSMIRERADWCISRQRHWGLPIPIFYCAECNEVIVNNETINAISDLFAKEGSNSWYIKPAEEIVPQGLKCPKCGHDKFTKETDTLDGWFDSGSSHAAVMEKREELSWPADVYLEGGDQYRGWFQSSLLTAVATREQAPYKAVVTHGWVVDGNGRKMGKSLGNSVDPMKICGQYGADILRLWVASSDYHTDMRISEDIFKQLSEMYLKIRNTCRFLLGNLADFDPNKQCENLLELDEWALWRLDDLVNRVNNSYNKYEYHTIFHAIHNFCVIDLSNFYLDIIKDRVYCEKTGSNERLSGQTAMYRILDTVVRLIAPVLAFTTEELWSFMPHHDGVDAQSILLNDIPQATNVEFAQKDKWDKLGLLRLEVNKTLESARASKVIGKALEAKVKLVSNGEELDFWQQNKDLLTTLFIVSDVSIEKGDRAIEVYKAEGEKCERCWSISQNTGTNPEHPTLCERCTKVVS